MECITINKLLGLDHTNHPRKKPYIVDGAKDALFIDEVMMMDSTQLPFFIQFMEDNPNLVLFATGDPHQLPTSNDNLTNKMKEQLFLSLFDNVIRLTYTGDWRG